MDGRLTSPRGPGGVAAGWDDLSEMLSSSASRRDAARSIELPRPPAAAGMSRSGELPKEPDIGLSNQNDNNHAYSRKNWRLLRCQNGKLTVPLQKLLTLPLRIHFE